MCFRQGKACVYASEEDGTIIIAAPPGGVVERLDTGADQITDSGPTDANANGTGRQPLIPKMTIVIGGNGAGKTTWCRQHPHELPGAFYNPDAIAQDLGDWNNAGNQLEAGRIVSAAIRRYLEQREDFGFESTYSGRSRPRIVRAAASNGYSVRAVFIGTNGAEINIERVRQRVRSGTGHDVPLPEITRRWSAAQTNVGFRGPARRLPIAAVQEASTARFGREAGSSGYNRTRRPRTRCWRRTCSPLADWNGHLTARDDTHETQAPERSAGTARSWSRQPRRQRTTRRVRCDSTSSGRRAHRESAGGEERATAQELMKPAWRPLGRSGGRVLSSGRRPTRSCRFRRARNGPAGTRGGWPGSARRGSARRTRAGRAVCCG